MEFKTTAGFLFVILMVLANESAGVPVPDEAGVSTTTSEEPGQKLCSRVTPCKWGVYDKDAHKRINLSIENPTCICGPERKCVINEDNLSKGAYIFRCVSLATTTPAYFGTENFIVTNYQSNAEQTPI